MIPVLERSIRALAGTALALSVAATPAWAAYTRINEPNPNDQMDVHIYRLENGLTVYLSENHETPRFYSEIAVRAGSKHDPAETTGLAHYLEHLLFKGNQEMGALNYEKEKPLLDQITALYEEHFKETDPEKRKELYAEINRISQEAAQYAVANEIDKVYKAMGGEMLNAYTSNEQTVYMISLPANRLEQWAVVESSRFVEPVFRIFHTELETVYEEKNRTLDNKDWLIYEAVNDALFPIHPYGQQTTIGTVEHLKNPSIVNIENYFNTYYVPNNMAISISGAIDIEETIKTIDEHFSSWKPKELPEPKTWDEKPLEGVSRVTVKYQGEEYVQLAFRTAPRGHKDVEPLQVLDMILDNATAGLININLNQQQKVRSAGSSPDFMNDFGTQSLFGVPKEGQSLEEVEQLLLDQIELIKKGEFEDWIIPAIVNDFKKNEKARLESDHARVSKMTDAFVGHQDWDYVTTALDRISNVAKEDVVRVANTYFGDNYVAGYRIDEQHEVPSIEKPQIDPINVDAKSLSKFAQDVLSMPYEPIEPTYVDPKEDFKKVDIQDGVTLYYSPNPLNDLFTFSVLVEFGTHEDNTIGIATRLLDISGAGSYSAEDLSKEWYKLGTDMNVSAGDNESYIRIAGLDENFDQSLKLLMSAVTDIKTETEALEQLKGIILSQREDAKKDPAAISSALTNYNRYGDESFYLRMMPSDALQALGVEELQAAISNLLQYKHTISYVGSLPLDTVVKAVKDIMKPAKELKDPPPYKYLYARQPDESEIYFFDKEMAQAQVRIEFPDGKYDPKLHTPIELYNSYFAGGLSGIVFQELRESRGLAYSAAARYLTASRVKDDNLMVGVIGCQADKTPEAVEAFLDIFDNLPEQPDRLQETITALDNQYRTSKIGFREVIGAVRAWEKLDLKIDPRKKWFENVQKASMEDLMAFHDKHIEGAPKMINIVGDKNRIDMERLGKIGPIKEITIDDIFVD